MNSLPVHQLEERLQQIVEGMIYVASRLEDPRMHRISKIFYFADRAHLSEYGRTIFGDDYIAMSYGPVPSYAYDVFKLAKGEAWVTPRVTAEGAFSVENNAVVPLREPNMIFFSESDLECLDSMIGRWGNESFATLTRESHDAAWHAANNNGEISTRMIIESLPNARELLEYEEAQVY